MSIKWRRNNLEKARIIERDSRYGLKPGQYEAMLIEQDNKCAACKCEFTGESPSRRPAFDHNHACCAKPTKPKGSCGKCLRGLICPTCNSVLGYVKDSIPRLEALISYLKKYDTILTEGGAQ